MGGGVALGYALKYPDRLGKLVLVDSYGLQDRAPFHTLSYLMVRWPGAIRASWALLRRSRWLTGLAVRNLFHNPQAVTEALVDEVFAAVHQSQAEQAFYAWQRHEAQPTGLRTVYMPRLGEVRAPTLVIHAANDTLVPVACAYQAAARLPQARLHILPGCGHWPQREQPQAFHTAVLAFLQET